VRGLFRAKLRMYGPPLLSARLAPQTVRAGKTVKATTPGRPLHNASIDPQFGGKRRADYNPVGDFIGLESDTEFTVAGWKCICT